MTNEIYIVTVAGFIFGLYVYFNRKDLKTLCKFLFWLTISCVMGKISRVLPGLGGKYVFKNLLILPYQDESSDALGNKKKMLKIDGIEYNIVMLPGATTKRR